MRLVDTVVGGIIGSAFIWLFFVKQFERWGYRDHGTLMTILLGLLLGSLIAYILSPYLRENSQTRIVSPFGMAVSVLTIFFWIIPMGMTGSLKSKLHSVPPIIRNQYRISCLFTHSSKSWHTIHYQVRLADQMRWQEGPLEGFFDLDIFGYRSKLNRIVLASRHKNKNGQLYRRNRKRLEELAHFIGNRWEQLNPQDSPVEAVRFYRVGHRVGEQHCMAREAWSRPSLSTIPQNKRELVISVDLEEDR